MVYILNLKDPASFIIRYIFSVYQGLNWGPSDPETDDVPMCHRASLREREKKLVSLSTAHQTLEETT